MPSTAPFPKQQGGQNVGCEFRQVRVHILGLLLVSYVALRKLISWALTRE
jgi:hypothetical protein